jgi:hypothetical protein
MICPTTLALIRTTDWHDGKLDSAKVANRTAVMAGLVPASTSSRIEHKSWMPGLHRAEEASAPQAEQARA